MTLIELVIVVAILVIVAAGVLMMVSGVSDKSASVATATSMNTVRDAILGTKARPGYLTDMGSLPSTMRDLFLKPAAAADFDRFTATGWRGPYLAESTGTYELSAADGFVAAYGADGDPAILDAWGHPIVLQAPTDYDNAAQRAEFTRLVSAGPNGIIETPANILYPDPNADRGDDAVLFLKRADVVAGQ